MAVAFVQKVASNSASGSTLVLTVGAAITTTVGHCLVLSAGALSGVGLANVIDSKGNTWQVDVVSSTTSGPRTGIASCIIATGKVITTGDTITLTWSASTAPGYGLVDEYSGVQVTAGQPVTDRVVSNHSGVASITTATAIAAAAVSELAVSTCMANLNSGVPAPTASDPDSAGTWVDRSIPGSPTRQDTAYQLAPATMTTFSATWTYVGASSMDACIATYQPAASLTVTSVTFPSGQVGVPYITTPTASGGTPPYTYSITTGAVPPGTTLTGGGAGTAGQFGGTIFMGISAAQTYINWNAAVGRTAQALKVYPSTTGGAGGGGTWSDGSGSTVWFPNTVTDVMQVCIDNGMTCFICYKPSYTGGPTGSGTTADYNAMQASLTALKAAGLKIQVIIGQEIENQPLSPAQYWAMLNFYKPAVVAALGTGHLFHDASGSYHNQWAQFFPAAPNTNALYSGATLVDHAVIDMYSTAYANGVSLTPYVNLCNAAGIGFSGVIEIGVSISTQTPPPPQTTLNYLTELQTIAAANPGGYYIWYQSKAGNLHNVIPGYASGSSGGPDCVPALQQLADIVTAGGGGGAYQIAGTPSADGTFGFTLKVTDAVAGTATAADSITIIPAVTPPPPPPPVQGPAPPVTAVPVPKPWRFLIAGTQPQGGWNYEIGQAQTRTLTMRAGPGLFHEATIDISGLDPAAAQIFELQADLQVMLGGDLLFCGRFGATQDTLDGTQHRFAPTATDYREVLRRRSLAYSGGPAFGGGGTDVQQIAWNLIQQTQGTPGGDLGIVQGQGKGGIGTLLVVNYDRQDYVGLMIDQLAQMSPGGFDWDITPYGASDLRFDVWTPNRGVNRGVTLEYGGSLVSSVTRNTDPSLFADSVFLVGQNKSGTELYSTAQPPASAGAVDAPDIATRPEGRWDSVIGLTAATHQGQLDSAAQWYLADSEAVLPTYSVVMKPGTWRGKGHIWLGDTVTMRISSGRLNVNDQVRVQELDFVIGPDNIETVTLVCGRYPFMFGQQIANVFRRLRALESL